MKHLSDEELAAGAYVLRVRAAHGDKSALREAQKLELILKNRLGPTPSSHAPLEDRCVRKPWWKLW